MKPLTTDTVLALHALHLMMIKNRAVTVPEIQRSSGFAPDHIRGVLATLAESGLIRSSSAGKYVLTKAPGEITIHQVVKAVDEPRTPTAPCGGDYDACATRGSCILAPLCRTAEQGFQETLRSFTLAELMGLPPELPACLDPQSKAS